MLDLRAQGRDLFSRASDARAKGRFLAAMPSFPFWIKACATQMAEIDEADDRRTGARGSPTSSTRPSSRALRSMRSLGQPRRSTMAEGAGGESKAAGFRRSIGVRAPRCLFDGGLMSYLMGDLVKPIAIQLRWPLASFLPGSVPGAARFAWRAVTLNTLGRWDEPSGCSGALERGTKPAATRRGTDCVGSRPASTSARSGRCALMGAATEADGVDPPGGSPPATSAHAWITYIEGEVSFRWR